jgi:hypothetical protein
MLTNDFVPVPHPLSRQVFSHDLHQVEAATIYHLHMGRDEILGASVAFCDTRTTAATFRLIAPGHELSPNAGQRPSLGKRQIWKNGSADEQANVEVDRDQGDKRYIR